MKIIDCHVHPFLPLDRMLADGQAAGIGKQCVFGLGYDRQEHKPLDYPHPPPNIVSAANDLVREMLVGNEERLCGLCLVNPRDRLHAIDEVRRCILDGPFLGIKLWIARRVSHPDVFALAEFAEKHGIPILVHCWNKITGNLEEESSTRDVALLAQNFPTLSIIAAHLTGQGERGIAELAPHQNVCIDTSGGDAEAGLMEFALSLLGAERILFGSDYPIRGYGSSLGRVLGASDQNDVLEQVLHRNFTRIFEKSRDSHD